MSKKTNVCKFRNPNVINLSLVRSNMQQRKGPCRPHSRTSSVNPEVPADIVTQLTNGLMNRLWIPHTSTIVGMLDVGLCRSNFDEISKWLAKQVTDDSLENLGVALPELEKRFLTTVDQFPAQ